MPSAKRTASRTCRTQYSGVYASASATGEVRDDRNPRLVEASDR